MNPACRLLLVACLAFSPIASRADGPPVNLILDTDMGPDCDDVGALFVLHGAVERGRANLLATIGCTSSPCIGPCLDAINTWFGRPEIPVAALRDPGFLPDPAYTREIAARFRHRFPASEDYPDALKLYREILARQPDQSVVIVAVGPLRNIANLLRSAPDDASPLDGPSLVKAKVKRLDVMGGIYPPLARPGAAEWNFQQDPAAASLVCAAWPTPVLFNGEGGSTLSGRRVTFEMPEHNPLTVAYKRYEAAGFGGDRSSWDPVSCLVAVSGPSPWYKVVGGGRNSADPVTGANVWQPGEDRGHSYLVLDTGRPKREVEAALEDLMVSGVGRPRGLKFDTAWHADAAMARFTTSGRGDLHRGWEPRDESSWWVECHYAEGRKYRLTSYTVRCDDPQRLPATLVFSASNDGESWTVLDTRESPGFGPDALTREFALRHPEKWNRYRLALTAAPADRGARVAAIELNELIDLDPEVAVTSLAIDQASLALAAHGRATLNATVSPPNSRQRRVAWKSSDPTIAEVRLIGEQSAIVVGRRPGSCEIRASIDGKVRNVGVQVSPSPLPSAWQFDEPGNPALPGGVQFADGTFTLTGCGHAITSFWERVRDQGAFVSQPVDGTVNLTARLAALGPNVGGPGAYKHDHRPSTAAGLMIREPLDEACGRFLLVQVDCFGNLAVRWRDKTGDQDDNQKKDLGPATLPVHLKLALKQGQIQVFSSADGKNWGDPKFTRATPFEGPARAGLFVCSGSTFASSTAVFGPVVLEK